MLSKRLSRRKHFAPEIRYSGALEIRYAFSVRVVQVNESGLDNEAQVEIQILDDKPEKVWLKVDPADVFYGSVIVKA